MIILLKSTKKTFWYKIAILVGFFFSILYQTRVFSDFFKKNIHFLGCAELSGIDLYSILGGPGRHRHAPHHHVYLVRCSVAKRGH